MHLVQDVASNVLASLSSTKNSAIVAGCTSVKAVINLFATQTLLLKRLLVLSKKKKQCLEETLCSTIIQFKELGSLKILKKANLEKKLFKEIFMKDPR